MKKLFTLVAMALMTVGANAQKVIAEVDLAGLTEFGGWVQFDDSQTEAGSNVACGADGLEITVKSQTGQLWQPQIMVIPDGTINLELDGNYKVVVVAKFPTDGELQINMGTWGVNDQHTTQVTSTGDFQEVEVEFLEYMDNAEGAHLLFQCGDFLGTTILKSVKVIDLDGEATGEVVAEAVLAGLTEFGGWVQFDDSQTEAGSNVACGADGLEITVKSQTGQLWQPQIMVIPDGSIDLELDGNYKVVVVAKFPTDGELQINMGTWGVNDQHTTQVTSTGDFQEVEVEFLEYPDNAEGAHVLFQCGDFLGTTILKSVTVINLDGTSGITNVNAVKPLNDARYNLAGQKVDASYKGVVIQNGKKYLQK